MLTSALRVEPDRGGVWVGRALGLQLACLPGREAVERFMPLCDHLVWEGLTSTGLRGWRAAGAAKGRSQGSGLHQPFFFL